MKTILLLPFLALAALLLGQGAATLYEAFRERGKSPLSKGRSAGSTLAGKFAAGNLLNLGLAGLAHLFALVRGGDLDRAIRTYAAALICAATICYLILLLAKGKSFVAILSGKEKALEPSRGPRAPRTRSEKLLLAALVILAGIQLLQILLGSQLSVQGDITAETTGSLLSAGALYSVNPMTGLPYAVGLPMRLKLLCLPTFYAMLCRVFGIAPRILVYRLMPAYWYLCGICAYGTLAQALFPEQTPSEAPSKPFAERTAVRRLLFLLAALFLLWGTDTALGLDGFGVLRSGWRAESIRGWILAPTLLANLFGKKWIPALLPVLAEGLILWTFFGTGTCALLYAGIVLAGTILSKGAEGRGKEAPDGTAP